MKKIIISSAVIGLLSIAPLAFAQSTVTGTLSSGGSSGASGSSLSGSVGSGNSLTGTVTSSGAGSGGGGGTTVAGNGPPVGGGGGGGPGTTTICPNLPNNLYALPAGYEIIDGNCDPIGTAVTTTNPGIPNTGVTTAPGIPNTGAGGNATENGLIMLAAGLLGTFAGVALFRKRAVR